MTVKVDSPPVRTSRRASPWGRGAAAAAAGALPALAFPAPSLWWLAYGALVPWMLLARSAPTGRRAALDGWLGGAGFMVAVHHWLVPSLHVFIVLLALLLGALWAPWGWLVRRLLGGNPGGRSVVAATVLVPCAWLLAELVRSWESLGGPWGLLGASQWQVAPALRLASVGGVWLVSFVLVAVNTALTALVAVPRWRGRAGAALVVCAVATAAVWLWAPVPSRTGTAVRVAVVQPGVVVGAQQRFDQGERLTRGLAGREVDLVVWGESSVGFDLSARPDLAARLAALSSLVGADVLVNVDARRADGRGISKTSLLIGPDGPLGEGYDKMRLVPFGEYVPARGLLGWATSVGRAAGEDRVRGDHQVVMDAGAVRLGPLVCFESAFPDMSRHLADDGAQLLVAQSSTSSFQNSWAPAQHASLAALRAAETGRPVVHATLTGISAGYDAAGRPTGPWLGTSRSATRVYEVPLAAGRTLYDRLGDWVPRLAVLLLAGAAVHAFRRSARSPR
ncbi:apolipoprotein N-acyltransferase [Streptomyces sp. MI02-7b]|uniref:apolipoprotein N-acyltransferase n=1 Tax=Streptomyces sp. MI02-7b TaxID=462941 RepID=UPI0029B41C49|nr:apolipoprotein N-acyltransferase [Streptomyces sp. MI02-7b]MDX3076205.1 apolipoprotein N-acyltransferase [Streptomyces sp. MI02-7b]